MPLRTPTFITAHAASRRRFLDEHMFRLSHADGTLRATSRLQLFAADRHRPVAIATRRMDEVVSLINSAEGCAATVWKQF
jgi:hypothetical protein